MQTPRTYAPPTHSVHMLRPLTLIGYSNFIHKSVCYIYHSLLSLIVICFVCIGEWRQLAILTPCYIYQRFLPHILNKRLDLNFECQIWIRLRRCLYTSERKLFHVSFVVLRCWDVWILQSDHLMGYRYMDLESMVTNNKELFALVISAWSVCPCTWVGPLTCCKSPCSERICKNFWASVSRGSSMWKFRSPLWTSMETSLYKLVIINNTIRKFEVNLPSRVLVKRHIVAF
jgi:hypothetical protein